MTQQTVIVTDGGTGIGPAVTQLLHARGCRVVALGLERDDDFPRAVRFERCDVTNPADIARCFDPIPRLAGLVTCAEVIRFQEEWSAETFERVMSINVTGVLRCAEAAADALEAGGGAIVNLASMWGWFGNPFAPAYDTSKGAVAALTRSLAVAWAARGIRVNAVPPGWVETRISAGARQDPERKAQIDARIPLGRWARTEEIAKVIAFLLSPEASYVHGAIVPVDGGYLAK